MGQSLQSKILNYDPVLQQQLLIGQQTLLGKRSLLRQSFKKKISQEAQIQELRLHFSTENTTSSETLLDNLRKHVNPFHISYVQSRLFKKLSSIAIDESELNQLYLINNEKTLSLLSYSLSVVQLSNEERLFLIVYVVEKIPINDKSLPITLGFLEEAAPAKDNVSREILDSTQFVEKLISA